MPSTRPTATPAHKHGLLLSALVVISVLVWISPAARTFLELIVLRVRAWFGA